MRSKHIMFGLVVVVLMGGGSTPLMAQIFPWWSFDSVLEEVQHRGMLRVGVGLFEPWTACNADGELIGFEIDVASKVAEDIGVDVEFVRPNWSYVIPSLIAEEFDVIIGGMTIIPARNLKVNFTSPYNAIGVYLVANSAQTADLETLADFNSPGVTIATRRGFAVIPVIETLFPEAGLLLFDTDRAVLQAVVAGEAHAAVTYTGTRNTWIEAHPDTLHLPSEEPFASEVTAIAVRKGDLDTLNFFNGWIAVRKADGWLEQRRQYWFEGREWADQLATDPDTIAECEESFQ